MLDSDFLTQFEQCTLPKEYFRHQGHLRVCWIYLTSYPFDEAQTRITQGILRFATSLGAAHIYHETLTRAWIFLVKQVIEQANANTFADFIACHPQLLDKTLPLNYYSQAVIDSEQAKQEWVPPDLRGFT